MRCSSLKEGLGQRKGVKSNRSKRDPKGRDVVTKMGVGDRHSEFQALVPDEDVMQLVT